VISKFWKIFQKKIKIAKLNGKFFSNFQNFPLFFQKKLTSAVALGFVFFFFLAKFTLLANLILKTAKTLIVFLVF
jgi:hypothetical protein